MTKATSRGGPDTKSRDVAGSGKSGFPIVQLEGRDAKHVFFLEAEKKGRIMRNLFFCVFSQFAIVQLVASSWPGTDRVLANRLKRLFPSGAPHTFVCRARPWAPSEGHLGEK